MYSWITPATLFFKGLSLPKDSDFREMNDNLLYLKLALKFSLVLLIISGMHFVIFIHVRLQVFSFFLIILLFNRNRQHYYTVTFWYSLFI